MSGYNTATDNLRTNPYEMEPILLPCPFCGSENVELDHLTEPDDYYVRCEDCEVQQIANYLPERAVQRWNTRTEPKV